VTPRGMPAVSLSAGRVSPELRNHYANFHFLRKDDNRNKTDKEPHVWFNNPGPTAPPYTDEDLNERLISRDLIQKGAFKELIAVRGERIRKAACTLFKMKEADFNEMFA
jgi:hypothetical protein